jgi:hypothetical protein
VILWQKYTLTTLDICDKITMDILVFVANLQKNIILLCKISTNFSALLQDDSASLPKKELPQSKKPCFLVQKETSKCQK